MAVKNKHDRLNQLAVMLEAHPYGLRKAEIARRMGVHRSTVGRYIDELSLTLPVWERDSRIGLENADSSGMIPGLDIYEGSFILFLLKLYEQEINIKNPHASSFIRKISGQYRSTAPVLFESLIQSAEALELDEKEYSKGYNDNFEKMAAAWVAGKPVKINYNHRATGESCSAIYEPFGFFTSRKRGPGTNAAVCGQCLRTGEPCSLFLADFSGVEGSLSADDLAGVDDDGFCPISEFGLEARPDRMSIRSEDFCIREANHRIKNSLFMTSSLIDITFSNIEDENVTDRIRGLQNRIDAIGEIHEQLSESNGSSLIQLNRYLEKLVLKNIKTMTSEPDKIKTKVDIDDIALDSVKALPLGMIISELLTNSFKHVMMSDSSCISLNVYKHDGIISVRYGDGENKTALDSEVCNTGLKLINGFCRQLDCKITYKSKYILLEFPA